MFDWEDMCGTLLSITTTKRESLMGFTMKLIWLRENMLPLKEHSCVEETHAYVRLYILGLIGGF